MLNKECKRTLVLISNTIGPKIPSNCSKYWMFRSWVYYLYGIKIGRKWKT